MREKVMQKYYKIITFGCQMNIHESEKLAGMLESLGYKNTDDDYKADVVVFNTCAIREMAEHKAIGNIGKFKPIKKEKKDMIIAVCGCMTQQKERAEEIKKTFPFVNIIFGTHNLFEFKNYLEKHLETKEKIFEIWGKDKDKVLPIESESLRTSGYNAWVNINYGCNNFCSYCIVPYVRGRERSRNFDEIVCECKHLVENGYKTITLLGQNVNSYGKDLNNENYTFSKLIDAICSIDGDFTVSFMSSHPRDLTSDIIDAIKNNEKMSRAIHLPVQSGSDRILKLMNRHYTKEKYLSLVEEIKNKIPDATLSTDIIVGFPGETDEDFNDTMELLDKVKYNGVFGFIYSIRKGTPAEKMGDQIPLEIKRERVNKLLSFEKQIQKNLRKEMVGKIVRALICGKDEKTNCVLGKLDSGREVLIQNSSDETLRFVKVKILDSNTISKAEIVD
ncbi:MAG: tRNA (N6-isopentenyl adenosine(37)-C2)-methylthiotransferase MiaB [Clostridiales bacterium]|nr:tRNA (N6-isopentenyl adenosine(37)-C2)-methylthiotransferase MiaB [Candidatus Apopatousia equi]